MVVDLKLKLNQLRLSDSGDWNVDLLRQLCDSASVEAILQMPAQRNDESDRALWLSSSNKPFSVKNAYEEILNARAPPQAILSSKKWKGLWRLKIPD